MDLQGLWDHYGIVGDIKVCPMCKFNAIGINDQIAISPSRLIFLVQTFMN